MNCRVCGIAMLGWAKWEIVFTLPMDAVTERLCEPCWRWADAILHHLGEHYGYIGTRHGLVP